MKVPLVDLTRQLEGEVGRHVMGMIGHVINSGSYASGKEVPAFEEEWSSYVGSRFCVGLSSCSDALYLCLKYFHDQGWQRVVTTPVSFWATTEAALRAGMQVDFEDIDPITGCISGKGRPGVISLPVQLYGHPLMDAPKVPSATIIEDCAQAHDRGRFALTRPFAQCYSFYPTKNLGALGMAGCVATDSERLAVWLRQMRAHGEVPGQRFVHGAASGNWRMDELQAAVLRAKLPYLDGWTARRREIAERYSQAFKDLRYAKPPHGDQRHVYHIYNLECSFDIQDGRSRADSLIAFLNARGIETGKRYPRPLHLMPAMEYGVTASGMFDKRGFKEGDFPVAEAWCRNCVNLPIFETMRDDEIATVIEGVLEWERSIA